MEFWMVVIGKGFRQIETYTNREDAELRIRHLTNFDGVHAVLYHSIGIEV